MIRFNIFPLFTIILFVTSCSFAPTMPTQATDLATFPFARENLFISSIPDSCLSVIDTDTKELIGEIKHDYFRLIQDFEVTDEGNLYLPLNGDYNTVEKEAVLLSLTDNRQHSVMVNYGPQKVTLSEGKYSLLNHNTISPESPGKFDLTIMSNDGTRKLYVLPLPGLTQDAVIHNNIAYIALSDFRDRRDHKIVEFDLKNRELLREFPLPAEPVNLIISTAHPERLYVSLLRLSDRGGCIDAPPGEIMEIQLDTGTSRVITSVKWPGKLLEIDRDHLLVAEYCGSGNHLRKINIQTGQIVQERSVEKSPFDLIALSDNTIAVAITYASKIIFIDPMMLETEKELPLSCARPRVMQLYRP